MPNISVPATAEGMPKISRSKVMHKAWELYRYVRRRYAQWQIDRGLIDASFSAALKAAWRAVKEEAVKLALTILPAVVSRLEALRAEIDALKYKPFGHHIARERVALEASIARVLAPAKLSVCP